MQHLFKTGLTFFAGFLIAATLSAFTHTIDIYQALGLAAVIAGTVLFLGALLTFAVFGAWIVWRMAERGLCQRLRSSQGIRAGHSGNAMTPAMFNHLTRRELSALHTPTKNELLAFVRNQMTPVIGMADIIATDTAKDPREDARVIANSARTFLAEVENLFKSNPNDGLGVEESE